MALYGLPKACKITHTKKDFVTTVSPHPVEAQESAPETGVGKCFQLWRSDRARGTASLAKGKGPWYNVHDPLGFALVLWLGGWRKGFSYATELRLDARRGIARCTRSPLQEDREVVAACTKL